MNLHYFECFIIFFFPANTDSGKPFAMALEKQADDKRYTLRSDKRTKNDLHNL